MALFLSLGNHEALSRRVNAALQERLPDFAFTSPSGGIAVVHDAGLGGFRRIALMVRKLGVLLESGKVLTRPAAARQQHHNVLHRVSRRVAQVQHLALAVVQAHVQAHAKAQ